MPADYPPRGAGGSGQRRPVGRDNLGGRDGRSSGPSWQTPPGPTGRPGASGGFGPQGRAPYEPGSSSSNVFRPYDANAASTAGPRRLPPAAQRNLDPFGASGASMLTSSHMEAIHRKREGFSIFHDGNVGHLWRGEFTSALGEGVLNVGIIIWLVGLTGSPVVVLSALLALGVPWLIVGPLGAIFENVREPARLLTWVGRLRMLAAFCIVGMHFLTIYPLLYLLIFMISLGGRLRQSLRVAAMRSCLAPGEIELVTNDSYIGSSVASVLGPVLGSLLYLSLGDRIIPVGVGAAILFLMAGSSDGALDALPEHERGYLQAQPVTVAPDAAARDDLLRVALTGDTEPEGDLTDIELTPEQRELALPEWYQQGPTHAAQAMGDITAGIGLAGGRKSSATALLTLIALALVGGGMAALEVFFLINRLNLSPLYLGVLVGVEAGGMALGAFLAATPRIGARGMLTGLLLTGVALTVFGLAPIALVAIVAAFGMGVANALAITGARQTLRAKFDGAERRAISAAESFVTALASLVGAALATLFYTGSSRIHVGTHLFTPLSLGLIFTVAGLGLVVYSFVLRIIPGTQEYKREDDLPIHTRARLNKIAEVTGKNPAVSGLWANTHDDGDDEAGYTGEYDEAGYTGEYDEAGYTGEYDEYANDDWDDRPPAPRGGSSRRR